MTPIPPHEIHGPSRRLSLLAYRLVRPILRPVAHRLRRFLTAELATELADARHRQEAALHRLDALLHRNAPTQSPQIPPPSLDPRLAAALERLLLTLALEDAARPTPPGLFKPPPPG